MPRHLRTMAAAAALFALSAHAQTMPERHVMSLAATATAEVTMDLLSITFSTTREGSEAASVQSQLKQALDAALVEARRSAKPGQVEVRTGAFSLNPRYGAKGGISGWQGTAQLVVEGRDIVTISQLAGRIQTLSVARVGFGLSREARDKLEAETTAQAIALFRERAAQQSRAFGYGGYEIREVQVGQQEPMMASPMPMMRAQAMAVAAEAPLPVEAGKTTVSTTVTGSVVMTR